MSVSGPELPFLHSRNLSDRGELNRENRPEHDIPGGCQLILNSATIKKLLNFAYLAILILTEMLS